MLKITVTSFEPYTYRKENIEDGNLMIGVFISLNEAALALINALNPNAEKTFSLFHITMDRPISDEEVDEIMQQCSEYIQQYQELLSQEYFIELMKQVG